MLSGTSLQDELAPEEWVRQFHAWAEGHDQKTRLLSDEAISRDRIYPDRLLRVLVDTNLIIRTLQPHHPLNRVADFAIGALRSLNRRLY